VQIERFLQSLGTRTRSKETLRAYRQDLERFEAFLQEKDLAVNQVKPTTITEFVNHLAANKGRTISDTLAPSTVARRLSVLSAYFDWLVDDSDGTVRNPVTRVKRPRVRNEKHRAAEDSDIATLVDGITDLRDKALVLLFVYSGLRLSELRQLDKTSLTLRPQQQPDGSSQYFGTGEEKRRSFIVGPKAIEAVVAYVSQFRSADDKPALFLSSRKQRLSCRAIQQILDKWCRRLNVNHLHIHQLRHSFATRNVNAGMSAVVLQELMGHASLTTSQRYFHIKSERVAREYFSVMEYVRLCSPV